MILVAGPDPSVAAAFTEERVPVDSVDDLPETIPEGGALLVDPSAVSDARALVAAARERSDGPLAVVALTDVRSESERERYDAVASDAAGVAAAVDHARRLVSYRHAVTEFYEACRRGEAGSRDAVDTRFADLDDLDDDDLAALLREGGPGE